MKLTLKSLPPLLLLTTILTPGLVFAEKGVLNIYVKDVDGNPAARAPIYIKVGEKIHSVSSDESGAVSLSIKAGDYTVSSAIVRAHPQGLDRFASPPARVEVLPQENTTVMLVLYPLDDPIAELSLTTLKKIGVATEVAKYLN